MQAISYTHNSGDEALLKEIIKCGADLDISDSNGWTPLHYVLN